LASSNCDNQTLPSDDQTKASYSDVTAFIVTVTRDRCFLEPPFFGIVGLTFTMNLPPAAAKARTSWSKDTSDAALCNLGDSRLVRGFVVHVFVLPGQCPPVSAGMNQY
jgi:hypothetical protein